MNYNTIVAAAVMSGQIKDARQQENQRIIELLSKAGHDAAVKLIKEESK